MTKKLMFCVSICCIASAAHADWTVVTGAGPYDMLNNGELVKASNFGDGATAQAINGIAFDTDYSNIGDADPASSSWSSKFYSGTDTAVDNLMNTAAKVSEGGPTTITFSFSGLTVGHEYRFQLLLGGDWNGCGANLYGDGWSEYKYVYFSSGTVARLATYTWIADDATRIIRTNAGVGQANHYDLAYALHDIQSLSPDITGDTYIDEADLAAVAEHWLNTCYQTDWCSQTDLNKSGRVDLPDFAVLAADWLNSTIPDLIGWWKLDDGSGTTASDHVAANDGTVYNAEDIDWNSLAGGFVFAPDAQTEPDELGEYIELPRVIQDDFTLAFWLRTTNTADEGDQWWVGKGLLDADAAGISDDFGVALTGNVVAFGVGEDGGADTTIKSTTRVNDGYWHHLAATRNGSTGLMELYVDGVLEASDTGSTGPKDAQPRMLLAGLNLEDGKFLTGWFDDVRAYDRCLLVSEIAQLAEKAYPSLTPKRGFGMVTSRWPGPSWQDSLRALNANWVYTWGLGIGEKVDGIEFVPMKWGPWGDFEQMVVDLNEKKQAGLANYVLGFNEPDNSGQANMTVEQALDLWPYLLEPNIPAVSPGCVHANGSWMQDFMAGADDRGLRVDYVAVHWYWHPYPNDFMGHLQSIWNLYNKPLWITEFAAADWSASSSSPNQFSPAQIYTFMAEILWRMEKLDYVHRYAWFNSSPNPYSALGTSSLFEDDYTTLTELGRLYSSFDGDVDGPDINTPYFLHHESSYKRLRSLNGTDVEVIELSFRTEPARWRLSPAETGYHYIINEGHNKKLNYDQATDEISLVDASVVTDEVKWQLVASEHGWYHIDHKASGKRLNYREDWGYVGVVDSVWTDGNVKWRFIKP